MKGWFGARKPEVSVVVVVHNMAREAPRTLYSLSAAYQRNIGADEYEVIVVDNGSSPPFDPIVLDGLTGNFRLIRLDPAPTSPALAINRGLTAARGDIIGVMIDGARMVTPGLLHFARIGSRLYPRPVVATLGWYLGFDHQRWSIDAGYDPAQEDALLESIDWPNDGYRLFEIASLDGSSIDGWFMPIGKSTALFLRREMWAALAGVDERFDVPGGGFLNLDTFRRAAELPKSKPVILLGEGAFHQVHGGTASNSEFESFSESIAKWRDQYASIRGYPWSPPSVEEPTYLGVLPRAALAHFVRSAVEPASGGEPPLGRIVRSNIVVAHSLAAVISADDRGSRRSRRSRVSRPPVRGGGHSRAHGAIPRAERTGTAAPARPCEPMASWQSSGGRPAGTFPSCTRKSSPPA